MKTKHGAEFADVRKFISDGQSFTLLTHISPMYGADDLLREVKGEAAFVQISERYDI